MKNKKLHKIIKKVATDEQTFVANQLELELNKTTNWVYKIRPFIDCIGGSKMNGASNDDIARMLNVSVTYLNNLKDTAHGYIMKYDETDADILAKLPASYRKQYYEYKEFIASYVNTKDNSDLMVENALFKSAMGGNVQAQMYYLNNRKTKEWQYKREEKQEEIKQIVVKLVDDDDE